jgi:hypothetical protein
MALLLRGSCVALLLVLTALPSLAQRASHSNAAIPPRFGMGFNALLSSEDGLGLGIQGRASAPFNRDLSFALDLGLTGFILQGRDDASYVFSPQGSVIVTFPGTTKAPYFLGGVGGYIPLSNEDRSTGGPTLHFGLGYVQTLSETSVYYEVNPALIIGETEVNLVLPLRVGIIF